MQGLLFIALCGCEQAVVGDGDVVEDTRMLQSFNGVATWGAIPAEVHVGMAQRVVIQIDRNLVSRIHTEVVDGVLEVYGDFGIELEPTDLSLQIELERLSSVETRGWGGMVIDGLQGDVLNVEAGGQGTLQIFGSANTLDLYTGETPTFDGRRLIARDVSLDIEGDGDTHVYATHSVDGVVLGDGDVFILGPAPDIYVRQDGNGDVVTSR